MIWAILGNEIVVHQLPRLYSRTWITVCFSSLRNIHIQMNYFREKETTQQCVWTNGPLTTLHNLFDTQFSQETIKRERDALPVSQTFKTQFLVAFYKNDAILVQRVVKLYGVTISVGGRQRDDHQK